ncbi:EamA family transporter [Salinimicrobium tongyeongense]|uniref:EamA family transporter n=1 Tax=Salinimicrobium tongyeongense TaxID=2809707 RepID=A0ABY6NMN3_9FLAO|nr:DMT family transporter [Salinimicrobium tongyeongense]UZH54147.1 EamA family transporter [Salinimicrobium tongyeongense]
MNNSILKGSLFVALGAISYGMLTTFVKMAYAEGYTSHEITFSQMALGLAGLVLINIFIRKEKAAAPIQKKSKSIIKLVAAGTSLGLTSTFYYLAAKYIPVSIGIVLLMQSVWMGVVLEALLEKKAPGAKKVFAVIAILAGTVLATNLLADSFQLDWRGMGWGLLAAMSYTVTIYTSNTVALQLHPLRRSLWMMLGGTLIVGIISFPFLIEQFNLQIIQKWGLILALFGTILPPILYTRGMPKTGVGLGAIVSSIELPAAVLMAYFLLSERVDMYQWAGIILILIAVIQMNLPNFRRGKA